MQIQVHKAGARKRISRHARRPRVRLPGVVIVATGRLGVRRARVSKKAHAKIRVLRPVDCAEKIQPVTLVVIGASPFAGKISAVAVTVTCWRTPVTSRVIVNGMGE